MYVLIIVYILDVSGTHVAILSDKILNISIYPPLVMHLPDDGCTSGRNTREVHCVHNILSCTYVPLLVLLQYLLDSGDFATVSA